MSYHLKMKLDDITIWKLEHLNLEFVKGFVFCFYLFYQNFKQNTKLMLLSKKTKISFTNDKIYEDFLFSVMLYRNIEDSKKKMYKSSSGKFTWWVDDTLIVFKNEYFLAGLITCFEYLELDFRDYTYGLPFKCENDRIEYYLLDGYDLEKKNN